MKKTFFLLLTIAITFLLAPCGAEVLPHAARRKVIAIVSSKKNVFFIGLSLLSNPRADAFT